MPDITSKPVQNRNNAMDLLRILATLAVISIHIDPNSVSWTDTLIRNVEFSAVTWCVPIFVMISGRFFLDSNKELPISIYFKKYIRRIMTAFFFWSAVYQIMYIKLGAYEGLNWKGILSEFLIGPYHMWFLWMICGLYLATPILRKIAEDKKISGYFVILFCTFSFLVSYGEKLPMIGGIIEIIMGDMQLQLVIGFTGYYVMGYLIHQINFSSRQEKYIYIVGMLSLVFSCVASNLLAIKHNEVIEYFAGYQKINVIFTSAALFTFFDKRVSRVTFSPQAEKRIFLLSELSFGTYLVHAIFNEIFGYLGITNHLCASLSVPVFTLIIFAISVCVTVLIRKIPYIGKAIT